MWGRPCVKTVEQLTPSEKDALNELTVSIYKDVSQGSPIFTYETTYYSRPRADGSIGEQLAKPLVLISGASFGPLMLSPETQAAIKTEMTIKGVGWKEQGKEHRLHILEGYLFPSPGGAGGSFGSSNDMVTIVPTKIEVE